MNTCFTSFEHVKFYKLFNVPKVISINRSIHMATSTEKTDSKNAATQKTASSKELKTEGPLSEKDEVKKAEDNTNKPSKKSK